MRYIKYIQGDTVGVVNTDTGLLETYSVSGVLKMSKGTYIYGVSGDSISAYSMDEHAKLVMTRDKLLRFQSVYDVDFNGSLRLRRFKIYSAGVYHVADGTSSLGDGEFSVDWCKRPFKLILPRSCKWVAEHALSFSVLSECNFDHIEAIDKQAFAMCHNLRSVESNSIMSIGERVFGGCDSLESVSVPTATKIQTAAFEHCSALKRADIRGVTAEFLDTSQTEYIFKECYGLEQLIVSQGVYDNLSKYAYQLGVNYKSKDFSNLEILPASDISIH